MSGGEGLKGCEAIVLAGGKGTRIRGVLGATPKLLAPVGDRRYLDILLDWLAGFGIARVVFALGVGADQVIAALKEHETPMACDWVVEETPLGTAGALRLALAETDADPVLALNGDSWTDADLTAFANDFRLSQAAFGLLCLEVEDCGRFGSIEINPARRITAFREKNPDSHEPGLINGGLYLIGADGRQALLNTSGPSLEHDFLAKAAPGALYGHVAAGAQFIDIGTPESLRLADQVIRPD
ncbi:MAG: sugar phosphate nucleotidyltransferase [Magnetovibrionaceae bacterium]